MVNVDELVSESIEIDELSGTLCKSEGDDGCVDESLGDESAKTAPVLLAPSRHVEPAYLVFVSYHI